MNKHEAIEVINNIDTLSINDMIAGQNVDMVIKNQVIDIISQIDTQPKVVVPEFVAEWLEKYKEKGCRLSHALEHVFDDVELGLYIKQQEGDCTEIIAKAWLDGYEVEKEQLYVVAIPDDERGKVLQLWKYKDGKLYFNFESEIRYGLVHKLTEQEIKQKDERLWQFAKPVQEEVSQ